MKPLTVSTTVRRPREDVFAFLAVNANHEAFNDHFMRDWTLSGPATGVGSRLTATVSLGGRSEPVEIEVTQSRAPEVIAERNVGAGGRRRATGTYRLTELAPDRTRIDFEYAWQRAPLLERMSAPIVRRLMRGALTTSMTRLAAILERNETHEPDGRAPAGAPTGPAPASASAPGTRTGGDTG